MQKFPKDSKDYVEKKYADRILADFPSYGEFWEKFIGIDESNKVSFLPRKPTFPDSYNHDKKKEFREVQLWLSKVNYSLFSNIVGADYHFSKYKKINTISKVTIFEALEFYECAYLHIGNIVYLLRGIFGKLKNKLILHPKYRDREKGIEDWLIDNNKVKHFLDLDKEPKDFRDSLVHGFGGIFTVIDGDLYFPSRTDKDKVFWGDMKFKNFVKGTYKLESHITLALKTCEDVYGVLIVTLDDYKNKEEIEI